MNQCFTPENVNMALQLGSLLCLVWLGFAHKVRADKTDEKLCVIYKQGNSAMEAQLEVAAVALRRLADLAGSTPNDKQAADRAERALRVHQDRQAFDNVA